MRKRFSEKKLDWEPPNSGGGSRIYLRQCVDLPEFVIFVRRPFNGKD